MVIENKDHWLQQTCPTIMAPKYEDLEPIEDIGYRYVIAQEGFWIEAQTQWGHFRKLLWNTPRPLHYGSVFTIEELNGGPIPKALIMQAMEDAKADDLEWSAWIVWSPEAGYEYLPLEPVKRSAVHVTHNIPKLEGKYCVLDLHSHPGSFGDFSATDDHDDEGGIYYAGVFYTGEDGETKLKIRLCIEGFYFDEKDYHEALFV